MIYMSCVMTATKNKILRTQRDVVEALGGPRAFQLRIGCAARTAPYNYIAGIVWPLHVHCKVIAACAEDGLRLAPALSRRIPDAVLKGMARYVNTYMQGVDYGK